MGGRRGVSEVPAPTTPNRCRGLKRPGSHRGSRPAPSTAAILGAPQQPRRPQSRLITPPHSLARTSPAWGGKETQRSPPAAEPGPSRPPPASYSLPSARRAAASAPSPRRAAPNRDADGGCRAGAQGGGGRAVAATASGNSEWRAADIPVTGSSGRAAGEQREYDDATPVAAVQSIQDCMCCSESSCKGTMQVQIGTEYL